MSETPVEKTDAEKLHESIPFGTHKPLDVVSQETGLSRKEILKMDGVLYAAITDQVRLFHPDHPSPKKFVKHG